MNHMLYLEVKDHDWFGRNDFIGCMAIPIKEIVEQKTLPLSWYKLLARSVGKEQYSRIPNDDEVSEVSCYGHTDIWCIVVTAKGQGS